MSENKNNTLYTRTRGRVAHVTGVCDDWCRQWRMYDRALPTAFLLGILGFLLYFITIAAPLDFPSASFLKLSSTASTQEIAETLVQKHIIRSAFLFTLTLRLFNHDTTVVSGEYFFPGRQSVFEIARRLARGDRELTPIRITFPEGLSALEMSTILDKKLPDFDAEAFAKVGKTKEGYLFPDTYFFMPGADYNDVIDTLQINFKDHIAKPNLAQAIVLSGHSLLDIVTMASLLEKEAPKTQDRRIIAGILWRRISIGMPLQVDAVFPYIMGKNSFTLTKHDLKTDHSYNTYKNKGLPPGPIANPGVDSLTAAMTPIPTKYLFYLSDMHGNFHFSVTYAQHLAYKRKYLDNNR